MSAPATRCKAIAALDPVGCSACFRHGAGNAQWREDLADSVAQPLMRGLIVVTLVPDHAQTRRRYLKWWCIDCDSAALRPMFGESTRKERNQVACSNDLKNPMGAMLSGVVPYRSGDNPSLLIILRSISGSSHLDAAPIQRSIWA